MEQAAELDEEGGVATLPGTLYSLETVVKRWPGKI